MDMTLGKRIMMHRKQLGLTQDKLAETLGVTAQAVSKWENDQSCPDITMLPRLAEVFHITTDELLGVVNAAEKAEPAEPEENVPVLEGTVENRRPGKDKHGFEFNWEPGKRDGIFISVFILLVGGLYLVSVLFDLAISFWSILWPCAVLAVGIRGFMRKFSFFSVVCTLFGGYFLLETMYITDLDISWKLAFPILILLLGVCLLVDSFKQPKHGRWHFRRGVDADEMAEGDSAKNDFFVDGEAITVSLAFSDTTRYISMEKLSAGDISCSFGELVVDLGGVKTFSDNCNVTASCSFGELELRVPRQIRVEPNTSTAFASIDFEGAPDAEPKGILHLDANVSFGEITIHYI